MRRAVAWLVKKDGLLRRKQAIYIIVMAKN